MRTVIIILSGFALWLICLGIAKFTAKSTIVSYMAPTLAFLALWFAAAATNMWVGVTQAGYSWQEELPIFLLIFGLPAVAALLAKWKFL